MGEGLRRSGYRGRGSRRSGNGKRRVKKKRKWEEEGQEEADMGEGSRRSGHGGGVKKKRIWGRGQEANMRGRGSR